MRNLFCNSEDLVNEADVESLFTDRLLSKLRYPDNFIKRKKSIEELKIGGGSKKELYRPDYVLLYRKKKPVIIIDAKSPNEKPKDYLYQVSGYSLALNQRYTGFNPVKYMVITNGLETLLYEWDNKIPINKLRFIDFEEDHPKFVNLRSLLAFGSLDIIHATTDIFEFIRPDLNELVKIFIDCHNLIWKKEKKAPKEAFYEFAKLMFIKLREDNRIAGMIKDGNTPSKNDFNFSQNWIEEQVEKGVDDNPVANILFRRIRIELENKIQKGEKKRIFQKDEDLNLRLSTIIEVVKKIEHFDLHGIDEDLNGRMFETFLNATVRGKDLGQFFTPRSVVKYMTNAANLEIKHKSLPFVLDGCCGSGGFLIEAMAQLVHKIDGMNNLSPSEKKTLKKDLYNNHLYGIDASVMLPISQADFKIVLRLRL